VDLQASYERILAQLRDDDSVLDVGSWSRPFPRADWVIDIQPFETRGQFAREFGDERQTGTERFSAATWVVRDICALEPWPFADKQFDFAVCAQTLEDVRDPLRVCAELVRVANAGYIEVPSRLLEQGFQAQGPWVGFGHHRWLIDIADGAIEFVFKHHVIHGRPSYQFPAGFASSLSEEQRAQCLFWEGSFEARERMIDSADELEEYLAGVVAANSALAGAGAAAPARDRSLRGTARAASRLLGGPFARATERRH
jgi:hypothetical protein